MNDQAREERAVVSELDAVIALADAAPGCAVGNEPVSRAHGHGPCQALAVWALRTHDGMGEAPSGVCPSIVLVCDKHMKSMWASVKHHLGRAASVGARGEYFCSRCAVHLKSVEDVIWGVERIGS
jgi:hypothetical protein